MRQVSENCANNYWMKLDDAHFGILIQLNANSKYQEVLRSTLVLDIGTREVVKLSVYKCH